MHSWLAPAPTVVRDDSGDERFVGRRPGIHLDGHFYCTGGHRVAHGKAFPRSEDTIICPHRGCGLLFFALGHATMGDDTAITIAFEITHDELRRIRRMNGRHVLDYLGVTWAPRGAASHDRRADT